MLLGEAVLDFSVTGRIAGTMGNRHRDMAPHGVYPWFGRRHVGGDFGRPLKTRG